MSKLKREQKFDDYFKSLNTKHHISYVDQFGLQDTNLNVTLSTDIELAIKEFFIFSSEGHMLVNTKFNEINCPNIGKFYSNLQDIVLSLQKSAKCNNNFNFNKIYLNNMKIIFLFKSHLTLVGIFSEHTNSLIIKLYLCHMFIAFSNFNYYLMNTLRNEYNVNLIAYIFSVRDMKNNRVRNLGNIDFNEFEFFQFKIFEKYFSKSLTFHFERVSKNILRKEEMYLSSIKFKNMYVIDMHTQEIIFDMMSMRKKIQKNKKFYKNEKLWQEVLFHSNNLMNSYKNSIGLQSDANETTYKFFFVKFECTSTFPRLTFIIKFLPILKGVSIIHLYSTKKLSRNSDSNEGNMINKFYKEIDILYGTEIKNNPNIEFRYIEPSKLQEIERFFFEFFISISNNIELFYDINHEIKYFDYSLLNKLSEILASNKTNTKENILHKINNYYSECYVKTKLQGNNQNDKIKSSNNLYYFMILNKEQYINEYYHFQDSLILKNNDKSMINATLNLSKVEEIKYTEAEGSFDITNKQLFLSREEEAQQPSFIIPVKAKVSSSVYNINMSQTIDYFVNEIGGEKKVNGAEENGGSDRKLSERSSFIKNAKNSRDRSSSFNNKITKKKSLSPVNTPLGNKNKEYFFISPGSPKFNYEI